MNKILAIVLMIVVSQVVFAQEMPRPPEFTGPENEEVVEVTVGEMRTALWYFEQFNALYPEYVRRGDALEEVIKERDEVSEKLTTVSRWRDIWKATTLVVGGITIGTATIYILTGGLQ